MQPLEALELALALHQAPARASALRARPLPGGVTLLLRVAGSQDEPAARASSALGVGRKHLIDAARFFVEQQLLARECEHDPWRILGVLPGADEGLLQNHRRLLISLTHPDRNDDWAEAYSDRVHQAWRLLKSGSAARTSDTGVGPDPVAEQRAAVAPWGEDGWVAQPFRPDALDAHGGGNTDTVPTAVAHRSLPADGPSGVSRPTASVFPWRWALPMAAAALVVLAMVPDGSFEQAAPDTKGEPQVAAIVPAAQPVEAVAEPSAGSIDDEPDQTPQALLAKAQAATESAPPEAHSREPESGAVFVVANTPTPTPVEARPVSAVAKPAAPASFRPVRPLAASAAPAETSRKTEVARTDLPEQVHGDATVASAAVVDDLPAEDVQDVPEEALPVAAAQPVAVRTTIETNPPPAPGYSDAIVVLDQFVLRYGAGDLEGLLALFSSRERSDGGASLVLDYSRLFNTTRERSLALSDLRWRPVGDRLQGEGRFEASYAQRGRLSRQIVRGRVSFEMVREAGGVRLLRLDSAPEGRSG